MHGRLLQMHGWEEPGDCSEQSTSPQADDIVKVLYDLKGPTKSTAEHGLLQERAGVSYRQLLGELMYVYILTLALPNVVCLPLILMRNTIQHSSKWLCTCEEQGSGVQYTDSIVFAKHFDGIVTSVKGRRATGDIVAVSVYLGQQKPEMKLLMCMPSIMASIRSTVVCDGEYWGCAIFLLHCRINLQN
jgi:hypothetical protein